MKTKTECRFANFEECRFKANEDGVVEGYAVVFDKPADIGGMFREYVDRKAITDNALKDVQFLVNHDDNGITLARSRNNNENSTMQLEIDDTGLHIKAKLDIENNSDARALHSAIKRGDIDGMSFRFAVADEKWDDVKSEYPTRTITKIDYIPEVSAVNWPAYPDTSIQARSADAERVLDNARAALDSADNSELELAKEKVKLLFI